MRRAIAFLGLACFLGGCAIGPYGAMRVYEPFYGQAEAPARPPVVAHDSSMPNVPPAPLPTFTYDDCVKAGTGNYTDANPNDVALVERSCMSVGR